MPSKRSYFTIGTTSNGLLRWNSNPRYTDWDTNLPGTKEIWIYLDTSTGYVFGAGSWIFHMTNSLAMRIKNADGEIGCGHNSDSALSFSSFASHFSTFVQYDRWIHLTCVYRPTGIDFGYNELLHPYLVALPTTVDPQTDNDRFSFGYPANMPISFH